MIKDQATSSTSAAGRVVVCADDPAALSKLCDTITSLGFSTGFAPTLEALLQELRGGEFDACVIDGYSLDAETAARLREAHSHVQCVLLESSETIGARNVIPAIACDILDKPCSDARLQSTLNSAVARGKLAAENRRLRARLSQQLSSGLVGLGPGMVALRERVHELADDDRPALIKGEPGTEIVAVARTIHAASRRAHRPFAKIDCALLTSESLERELFGTNDGGNGPSSGRLDWAEGGSLLLENIDQASQRLHERICQVIAAAIRDSASGQKDGSHSVRLILSVQENVSRPDDEARFCETLCGMLAGTAIAVPPLRERLEDLGLLAESTLDQLAAAAGRPAKRLSLNALNLLREHHWPENLAELQRILQQASSCDSEMRITAESVRPWLATGNEQDAEEPEWLSLREMERRLIETTFARCGGNRERTAKALKIGLRTLSGKLREYGYPPRGGPGSNREQTHDRAA
jgi:DNA-binding NtrC family response regulator